MTIPDLNEYREELNAVQSQSQYGDSLEALHVTITKVSLRPTMDILSCSKCMRAMSDHTNFPVGEVSPQEYQAYHRYPAYTSH